MPIGLRVTSAMEAGLTDQVISLLDLVGKQRIHPPEHQPNDPRYAIDVWTSAERRSLWTDRSGAIRRFRVRSAL